MYLHILHRNMWQKVEGPNMFTPKLETNLWIESKNSARAWHQDFYLWRSCRCKMSSLHVSVYLICSYSLKTSWHIYYNAVYAYWMKICLFLTGKLSLLFYYGYHNSSANSNWQIVNGIWLEYWQLLFIYCLY